VIGAFSASIDGRRSSAVWAETLRCSSGPPNGFDLAPNPTGYLTAAIYKDGEISRASRSSAQRLTDQRPISLQATLRGPEIGGRAYFSPSFGGHLLQSLRKSLIEGQELQRTDSNSVPELSTMISKETESFSAVGDEGSDLLPQKLTATRRAMMGT